MYVFSIIMSDKPILTYFNIPGRAELLRLILAYAGQPFTDRRVTNREFDALKAGFPFGQVPVLETEEHGVIAQTGAIARYLAHK